MSLVEAIPNASEGRRSESVDAMAAAFTRRDGAWLLDVHVDPSHHRSVLTAALEPAALVEASCALAAEAIELIDLNVHEGVHPRTGALDVLPLVPLDGVSRVDVVELARDVAAELAARFDLPVFLYGEAVFSTPRALRDLRRGGFETLQARIDRGELTPDFGPTRLHPTAGVTAVGVRDFLIAYNVALATKAVSVAHTIARAVRESSGGMVGVQALGMALPHRNLVQVSMNLTRFPDVSLVAVFDAVRAEAKAQGVEVDHSEIVGLIPRAAAFDDMVQRLELEKEPGILEERLKEVGAR